MLNKLNGAVKTERGKTVLYQDSIPAQPLWLTKSGQGVGIAPGNGATSTGLTTHGFRFQGFS